MKIRRILAAATAGLLVLGLSGVMSACTKPAAKQITIGMANLYLGGPYFVGMRNAVQETGASFGWKVNVSDAGGDSDKLLADVENFISQKVNGIVISGAWLNDFPEVLNAAEKAKIPVVLVDRLTSSKNYSAWVGPDNPRIGEEVGKYFTQLKPNGGVAVIIKGGPADNTIGIARTEGVLKGLNAAGNWTIEVSPDFGNWATDGGKAAMENMLAKLKKIDVVFCENDSMCLGAQSAAADAGRSDEMIFGGVDGQNEAIQEILKGTNYKVTGYNDASVIGKIGTETLKKILDGQTVPHDFTVDSPMINIDNAAQYKDAGLWK